MVLILEMLKDIPPAALSAFPSPYGDYGSYHNMKIYKNYNYQGCFRPLAEIMVLILFVYPDGHKVLKEFPSPCGDYGFYPKHGCLYPGSL